MKHTTTAPMIREALADEGVRAEEYGEGFLRVPLGGGDHLLLCAYAARGVWGADLPMGEVWGFGASEFERGATEGGAVYCFTSGWASPVGTVEQEVRRMAQSVNRTVRGRTGVPSATLLAAPLVAYLAGEGAKHLPDGAEREVVRQAACEGELWEDGAGIMLLREPVAEWSFMTALFALKGAVDALHSGYTERATVTDEELAAHGVSAYMLRVGRSAVHDSWRR